MDRYLGEALSSVLNQADITCSIVVVDGGSDTPIVLPAEYRGNPAIRLIRSEEPLLVGGGRNLGASVGSAPWLTFLDADDLWPASSRRALLDACVRESADLAVGMVETFHSDEESRRALVGSSVRTALLAGGVLMSRSAWHGVGPFDASLRSGEFIEWYNRFTLSGLTVASIDETVLRRRLHLSSTTANQIHGREDYLEVVRRWMSRKSS